MKNSIKIISLLTVISFFIFSCDTMKELVNMTQCKFKMKNLSNPRLAGVNIQGKKRFKDFGIMDAATISSSLLRGVLPLSFTLNVDAKNPNGATAAMEQMEWIVLIDDSEVAQGISEDRIEIGANQGITIPLQINLDLKKVLSGKSRDAMLNFGLNLADAGGQPTRVSLKIKPTIKVGSVPIAYPGYFTVKKEFSSN